MQLGFKWLRKHARSRWLSLDGGLVVDPLEKALQNEKDQLVNLWVTGGQLLSIEATGALSYAKHARVTRPAWLRGNGALSFGT